MIARGLETPSVKRFDGLGAIGDVRLSSKLDGLWLFPAPMLPEPLFFTCDEEQALIDLNLSV